MTVTGDGVRESLVYPNSRTISFTHDGLHRLTGITEAGNTIADYTFKGRYLQDRGIGNDSGNRVVKLTFRDQADLDGYDRWGRINWMRHYKVSGGTDIAKLAYDYSYASDRKYQQDLVNTSPHQDEFYSYDTLHRLTNYKRGELNANKDGITGTPTREQTWVLDALGNWENPSGLAIDSNDNGSDSVPSDARNHFSVNEIDTIDPEGAIGSFDVIHDDAGNLRILPDRTDPTNKADKYVYDYRNRLIEVWHTTQYNVNDPESSSWGNDPIVRYYYDGLNRRVKKDLNSGTDVVYLYDGWRCIEEREDDGGTWEARRQYVYGGIYIDEPLIFDKDTDSDGDCTDAGGSSRLFYCQQANFNVVALAESDGDVVEKVTYDPYGEYSLILDGSTGNALFFQGQRWDSDADLYYFRNRDLSPQLGRFLQRDPKDYADGMNCYTFGGGAPIQYLDPLGLEKKSFIIYTKEEALTKWWRLGATVYPGETVPTDSLKDAVDKIIESLDECDCIGSVEIWSHGCPGQALVGKDWITSADFTSAGEHYDDLSRLKEHLCDDAFIYFRTCSTFAGDEGAEFAKDAGDFFDSKVGGHLENIALKQPGYVEYTPGEQPQWMQNGEAQGKITRESTKKKVYKETKKSKDKKNKGK